MRLDIRIRDDYQINLPHRLLHGGKQTQAEAVAPRRGMSRKLSKPSEPKSSQKFQLFGLSTEALQLFKSRLEKTKSNAEFMLSMNLD
jgi:hypothetical protein